MVEIDKIIRSRRRTLGLQITPDAALVVRAPNRISLRDIYDVVNKKISWIVDQQRRARERYQPPVKREFVDGAEHLYVGEWRKFFVNRDNDQPLVLNENGFSLSDNLLSEAPARFEAWYRERALEIIGRRAEHYSALTGLVYSALRITGAQSRWGSCSTKKKINFSWRLVMAPLWVIDYVVVHELVHLEEHNHSPRFWGRVSEIFPNYREAKKWLQRNQNLFSI